MNPLHILTGSAKARLLYDLFPHQMMGLLDDIEDFCRNFRENQEDYRKLWKDGFMPFDYWLNLSEETAALIKKHRVSMLRSSRVFSDQLYFSYTSIFVTDRIVKFAEQSEDEKFRLIVKAFFC